MKTIVVIGVLLALSACSGRSSSVGPVPPYVANPDWPRDHCGEPYEPGTAPINTPGLPCK